MQAFGIPIKIKSLYSPVYLRVRRNSSTASFLRAHASSTSSSSKLHATRSPAALPSAAGGADLVSAQACGANTLIHVADSSILKRVGSDAVDSVLYATAVTGQTVRTSPSASCLATTITTTGALKMAAVARMISDYNEFVDAIRERADEISLSRYEIDHQADLRAAMQANYSGRNK
jgi:hypothetical protein